MTVYRALYVLFLCAKELLCSPETMKTHHCAKRVTHSYLFSADLTFIILVRYILSSALPEFKSTAENNPQWMQHLRWFKIMFAENYSVSFFCHTETTVSGNDKSNLTHSRHIVLIMHFHNFILGYNWNRFTALCSPLCFSSCLWKAPPDYTVCSDWSACTCLSQLR